MKGNVFITGADRGLGLALVKQYLSEGYVVYAGSYLSFWHELEQVKNAYADNLTVIPLDVSSDQSALEAKNILLKHTDKLDILINNAGIYLDEHSGNILEKLNFAEMLKMYDVNTLGPLRVTNALVDVILRGEKKLIVNISSEAGSIGQCFRKKEYGYSMTKAALNMQSVILQNHLKEYGVKVLAIHPGWVRSYMLGRFNENATVDAETSALGIYKLTLEKVNMEDPMYMDYEGNNLPW